MLTGRQKVLSDNKIIRVDPADPDPDAIQRAISIIHYGGVVVYPTTLLYGLGADACNPQAVERVYSIKQRADEKPVSILISHPKDLSGIVRDIPEEARRIMDRLWPGKVTLVFYASERVIGKLTAGTGKIGVRLPLHPVAAVFLDQVRTPVTATSANISGHPGCRDVADMPQSIMQMADLVLDAGQLPGGSGSTVVDVTTRPPTILREGSVSALEVIDAAGWG